MPALRLITSAVLGGVIVGGAVLLVLHFHSSSSPAAADASQQCVVAVSGTTIDVVFEGPRATKDCGTFAKMSLDETGIQPGTLNPVGAVITKPFGDVVCVHTVPDQYRRVILPPGGQAAYEDQASGYVTVTVHDAGWPLGGTDPTNFCRVGGIEILPGTYI